MSHGYGDELNLGDTDLDDLVGNNSESNVFNLATSSNWGNDSEGSFNFQQTELLFGPEHSQKTAVVTPKYDSELNYALINPGHPHTNLNQLASTLSTFDRVFANSEKPQRRRLASQRATEKKKRHGPLLVCQWNLRKLDVLTQCHGQISDVSSWRTHGNEGVDIKLEGGASLSSFNVIDFHNNIFSKQRSCIRLSDIRGSTGLGDLVVNQAANRGEFAMRVFEVLMDREPFPTIQDVQNTLDEMLVELGHRE
jgi:hypothetical protein